jgi:cerevisin
MPYIPSQLASYLPLPTSVAPIPPTNTISPKQLKKAIIAIASKDILSDIPEKTVNYLAYNNASALMEESEWVFV